MKKTSIETSIEVVQQKGINADQPFRRLINRCVDEKGEGSGPFAIIDQDSLQYRQAQDRVVSTMKGDILICGPIGFGYLLHAALNNLKVTSVSVSRDGDHPVEKQAISNAESHHKFRGINNPPSNHTAINREAVGRVYDKLVSQNSIPKKRIGKFI